MTNSDNMNLRGKRRVLVLLDVQQDYYKHTAEDKRRAADRDYTLPGVKSRVIEWLDEHEMDEVREVFGGSLKGYEYIIADEEGRFNSHALKESVGKFVSFWEQERTDTKSQGSAPMDREARDKLNQALGQPPKADMADEVSSFFKFIAPVLIVAAILYYFLVWVKEV